VKNYTLFVAVLLSFGLIEAQAQEAKPVEWFKVNQFYCLDSTDYRVLRKQYIDLQDLIEFDTRLIDSLSMQVEVQSFVIANQAVMLKDARRINEINVKLWRRKSIRIGLASGAIGLCSGLLLLR
jgi:hypothetical protein